MLRVGIIGAGGISRTHIKHYKANPYCEVKAISDINIAVVKKKAEEYGIENVYEDYHDILNDESIDAVSILTPTYTHKEITLEALRCGKHVLCEKPPALTGDDVAACREAAQKYNKCLMYAFVFRFRSQVQYLKKYIESGRFGDVIYAEATRMVRCSMLGSWFVDKTKSGGGHLMDAAIHELDTLLYLMGYPEPKRVVGFADYSNRDLPGKIQGINPDYVSDDKVLCERTIESFANGHITFKNGACLYIKSGNVIFTVDENIRIELSGKRAGAKLEPLVPGNELALVECTDDNFINEFKPNIQMSESYQEEINHFVDCCINGTECICKPEEAQMLMGIMNAIYKSAETGEPVYFD